MTPRSTPRDLVAAPQSPHRLVYQTDALTAPVHVSGTPNVSLRLSFSKPAAVVSAMLVDYRADGTRRIITRGWIDPQNRHSIWFTSPIKAGKHHEYQIDFDLMPHDYEFQAGSRIGLVLLSSDWEGEPPLIFTLRPPPGTEITRRHRRQQTHPACGRRGEGAVVSHLAVRSPPSKRTMNKRSRLMSAPASRWRAAALLPCCPRFGTAIRRRPRPTGVRRPADRSRTTSGWRFPTSTPIATASNDRIRIQVRRPNATETRNRSCRS